MLSDEEDDLIDFLEEKYGCHTVILYGSRAWGPARPDSDWDIIALNDAPQRTWCHETVRGIGEVSAYIFPSSQVAFNPGAPSGLYRPLDNFVRRLRNARVLVEKDGLGMQIIARAQDLHRKGMGKKPAGFDQHTRHTYYDYWLKRMTDEKIHPLERRYLKSWLLYQALDDYFHHRELWAMAPRHAFPYLEQNDLPVYQAFEKALSDDASFEDVKELADKVLDPRFVR